MNTNFLVCVRCHTYNHVNYVTNSLDGFCMQKTKFPYVCCIIDDASTDGTQDVIIAYLQDHFLLNDDPVIRKEDTDDYKYLFARHKDNENCFIVVYLLKYNHYSIKKSKFPYAAEWQKKAKYEALCEGDDYWIDPLKLQKQFDVLENHPECTISFCKVQNISKKGTKLKTTEPSFNLESGVVTLDDFLKYQYGKGEWVFQTSGYFYKTELFEECTSKSVFYKMHPVGDEPLVIELLLRGNGYYISDICSCYRVQSGGHTSVTKSSPELAVLFQKKIIEVISFLDEYTNRKYHNYIECRKLIASFYIDYFQGNYKNLFKLKYFRLLFILPKRVLAIVYLRVICPPLYWRLKRYRLSH